jgi:hypothetical protein
VRDLVEYNRNLYLFTKLRTETRSKTDHHTRNNLDGSQKRRQACFSQIEAAGLSYVA